MALKENKAAFISKHAFLIIGLLFAFLPLYVMIVISFKTNTQFNQSPVNWTFPLHFGNYREGWDAVGRFIFNTIVVSTASIAGALLFSSMSAFVFGRYNVPLGNVLFALILAILMIPGVANLVPMFILVKNLHLLNTLWVLIIPGWASGQVISIFILRTFFREIPQDLFDAARVDGANHWQQYLHIALPMAKPILATLVIILILSQWNNYIWPLVTIRDERIMTLSIGLAKLAGEYTIRWGTMMAGYVIASLPMAVLFIFAMKSFIKGIATGVIKG